MTNAEKGQKSPFLGKSSANKREEKMNMSVFVKKISLFELCYIYKKLSCFRLFPSKQNQKGLSFALARLRKVRLEAKASLQLKDIVVLALKSEL